MAERYNIFEVRERQLLDGSSKRVVIIQGSEYVPPNAESLREARVKAVAKLFDITPLLAEEAIDKSADVPGTSLSELKENHPIGTAFWEEAPDTPSLIRGDFAQFAGI